VEIISSYIYDFGHNCNITSYDTIRYDTISFMASSGKRKLGSLEFLWLQTIPITESEALDLKR